MACFTKNQQRNGTNCQFEKYVTTSNYFVFNSLDKGHLNSVCTHYVCDKSENARVCAKWQWNALDWCYWIALPASPVVQSSNSLVRFTVISHTPVRSRYMDEYYIPLFYMDVIHCPCPNAHAGLANLCIGGSWDFLTCILHPINMHNICYVFVVIISSYPSYSCD